MAKQSTRTIGTLGQQVRRVREGLGLTQPEAAERAQMDQGQLSRIERDLCNPGIEILGRLADALCATVGYDGERWLFAADNKFRG